VTAINLLSLQCFIRWSNLCVPVDGADTVVSYRTHPVECNLLV